MTITELERAARLLTAKMRNLPDCTIEDAIRTTVADMDLLHSGALTLDDYDPDVSDG